MDEEPLRICITVDEHERLKTKVERLKAENERLLNNSLDRQLYKVQEAQLAKLREAVEYARNVLKDIDEPAASGYDTYGAVEVCDKALKGGG